MENLKINDLVIIKTPSAVRCKSPHNGYKQEKSMGLNSETDRSIGAYAVVTDVEDVKKCPFVRVGLLGVNSFYGSYYTGWEFKKC